MDIQEKMKLCFNDKLETNEVLTINEKKVIASLLYSYKICKEAKDNTIIRAINELRKDIKISTNALYDSLRSLEELYHMIERVPGETRKLGQPSIATKFKLHFDKIFNPPVETVKFDFSKELESPEKPINTVDIDTDIETDIDIDVNVNTDVETNMNKDEVIVEVPLMKTKIINNLSTGTSIDYKQIEESIRKDELEKDLIKKQFEVWAKKVNKERMEGKND